MNPGDEERICFRCNYYFPASIGRTEYGFCLEDKDFEPYIEDILGDNNLTPCQELIEQKKFLGDREACEHFEEAEMVEIEDDSPLGMMLSSYLEHGEIDENMFGIDIKTLTVQPYVEKLASSDVWEQESGLKGLGSLAIQGNKAAFEVLLEYLKGMPPPETIEEVHRKVGILASLEYGLDSHQKSRLFPVLIDDLCKVVSNNTTRQWITKVLQYLEKGPAAEVRPLLETLLRERKWSYRNQQKIKAVLEELERRA